MILKEARPVFLARGAWSDLTVIDGKGSFLIGVIAGLN